MPGLFGLVRLGPVRAGAEDLADDLARMAAALRFRDSDRVQTHIDRAGRFAVGRIGPAHADHAPWPLESGEEQLFAVGAPEPGGPDHGLGGHYAALRAAGDGGLALQMDRRGYCRIHYEIRDNLLIFAPEIKALLAVRDAPPALDLGAIGTFLSSGMAYHTDTFFEGVRRLGGGTRLEVAPDGKVTMTEHFRFLPGTRTAGAPRQNALRDELTDLVVASARRGHAGDGRTIVFLSGGVDSRVILAGLVHAGIRDVATVTWGDVEGGPQSDDGVAARIARHLGLEHTELRRDWSDAVTQFGRINTLLESCSEMPFQHAPELATLERLAAQGGRRTLRGDEAMGLRAKVGAYNLEQAWRMVGMRRLRDSAAAHALIAAPVRARMIDASETVFQRIGQRYDGLTPDGIKDALYFDSRMPNYLGSASYWRQTLFDERNILLDDDILDFTFTVPDALRTRKMLLKAVVGALARDWPTIPFATEDTLLPPTDPRTAWAAFDTYADAALADRESGIWDLFDRDAVAAVRPRPRPPGSASGPGWKKRALRAAQGGLRTVSPALAQATALRLKRGHVSEERMFWRVLILKDWHDRFVTGRI